MSCMTGLSSRMSAMFFGNIETEKKMPDAGLAVLEGAGHFSYAEKYPQFCAVMKAYLKE